MSSLNIFFEDILPVKILKRNLKKELNFLCSHEAKKLGDISIILCSDEYLLEMNRRYLEHDYLTDIITFDYSENDRLSGDLYISLERVTENAEEFENDAATELLRVIFHGVLHLAGYKDKKMEDEKVMRKKEDFYLKKVNDNPVLI